MASINLFAKGQSLRLTNSCYTIVSDTINYITAEVKFLTDDWSGLVKWLHFRQGDKVYDALLDSNGCVDQNAGINLEEGKWELYIHGNRIQDGEATQRITTNIITILVQKTGVLEGEPLPEIVPSAGEQILATAEDAKRIAQSVRDDADNGKFKGDKGDKGNTGATPNITATVNTGVEGSNASVTTSGTPENPVLNFTIPRGNTGATGPQGIQGEQGPKGDPGLDGVQIDDTTASTDSAWSGNKVDQEIDAAKIDVIDRVCPPFVQSGSVIQRYPVEGYPLDVVTRIEAVQEGEGEPSPDNVRPIRGWDTVEVTRCGENLLSSRYYYAQYGMNRIYISNKEKEVVFPYAPKIEVAGVCKWFPSRKGITYTISVKNPNENYALMCAEYASFNSAINQNITLGHIYVHSGVLSSKYTSKSNGIILVGVCGEWKDNHTNLHTCTETELLQAEIGVTPTEYAPYTGTTYTQALPETVYGGSYNWATGELVVDREAIVLTAANLKGKSYFKGNVGAQVEPVLVVSIVRNKSINDPTWRCSHFKEAVRIPMNDNEIFFRSVYFGGLFALRNSQWESEDDALAWLDERYAAGDPVTVEYPLLNPYTIHLTPQQILSIPGVNTVFSNTGDTTVSGRADPIRLTQTMLDRLAALEAAQTGL